MQGNRGFRDRPGGSASDLLRLYVDLHNRGVRERAFDALCELFADNARMSFVGLSLGPFQGRAEITGAFRDHPPDDEIVLGKVTTSTGEAAADYAWLAHPRETAGGLHLRAERGRIVELRICPLS